MNPSSLNALARHTKAGEITLRNYVTGVIVHTEPDGSKRDEFTSQWRCIVEPVDADEIVGRGQTPDAAVKSALKKVLA